LVISYWLLVNSYWLLVQGYSTSLRKARWSAPKDGAQRLRDPERLGTTATHDP
jgi:hypothetical protein